MGWKNRAWYLGDLAKFGGPVFDTNGNAGPTIWVDGRVVGGTNGRSAGLLATTLVTGDAALAAGVARFLTRPFVRGALLVGRLTALAGDLPLLGPIHRSEPTIFLCHVPSSPARPGQLLICNAYAL